MPGLLRVLAAGFTVLIVLGVTITAVSYWWFVRDIDHDVARLLAEAHKAGTIVDEAMLASLPPPAQRYFRYAGVVGTPIPSIVRLTQTGRIRSSADAAWMNLDAEETYSTNSPSFVWRAWLPSRFMPVALGRDEYLGGKGSILIKLLALASVADEHGDELAAAGLMRYLNEMMWFPAALLGSNVSIMAVDDESFAVHIKDDRGETADALMLVDREGRLTNFRARRFNTGTHSVETWETPIGAYGEFEGLRLPAKGAAVWKLPSGDLTYIELEITGVNYS